MVEDKITKVTYVIIGREELKASLDLLQSAAELSLANSRGKELREWKGRMRIIRLCTESINRHLY